MSEEGARQGRVATETLRDESDNQVRSESYTWDSLGRLATVENAIGTYTIDYKTNLPRPSNIAAPNSLITNFVYWADTESGGRAGRLAWITHLRGSAELAKHLYGYDTAGRITSWERRSTGRNTRKSTYTYNLGDELVDAEDKDLTANTVLDRETWGLDDGGNWLSRSRSTGNLMETRSVDVMNRLTRTGGAGSTVVEGQVNELSAVSVNGQPAELRADAVAGGYRFRRSVPVSQGTNTITVTAADTGNPPAMTTKSWSLNVPAVARSFTYDANGNTLSDGQRTFTWDAKNRLRTVTKDGTTWKWDYDYLDRRVREYIDGTLTRVYVWSGNEIIQERSSVVGGILRTHYYGGFSDGSTPATSTKYQTLTDHLGNIREVLTTAGAIAARYDYTPYQGPVKVGNSTVDPTFLTIGRYQHHAGSGLELALYRAYDPELGRWLSEDPLGEDGGVNLYGYVLNRPLVLYDAFGLDTLNLHDKNDKGWKASDCDKSFPKEYTVGAHGNPYGLYSTAGGPIGGRPPAKEIPFNEIVRRIKSDPNWQGRPVRLMVCSAGGKTSDGSPNIAQRLAKALNVTVTASTTDFTRAWVDDGNGNCSCRNYGAQWQSFP